MGIAFVALLNFFALTSVRAARLLVCFLPKSQLDHFLIAFHRIRPRMWILLADHAHPLRSPCCVDDRRAEYQVSCVFLASFSCLQVPFPFVSFAGVRYTKKMRGWIGLTRRAASKAGA